MNTSAEKSKSLPRRLRWRTLFKLAILAVFMAMLIPVLQLGIPALAYRDDLLALLNYSDDCRAPCFMGITPGVTTRDEAVNILKQQDWIKTDTIQLHYYNDTDGHIAWYTVYEETHPPITITVIYFTKQTISHMYLYAPIPLITYMSVLSLPDGQKYYDRWNYVQQGIEFELPCGSHFVEILAKSPTYVQFNAHESDSLRPFTWTTYSCSLIQWF